MTGIRSTNPYLETRIKTAGSLELTAIMYDVLVASLERATRAIEEGRVEERVMATNRAVSALVELRCALNFERGGELATSLDRLYAYGLATVTGGAAGGRSEELGKLVNVFAPLRDAWRQAAESHEAETSTANDAATLSIGLPVPSGVTG